MEEIPILSQPIDVSRIRQFAELAASAITGIIVEPVQLMPIRAESPQVPSKISPNQRYLSPERRLGATNRDRNQAHPRWPM